MRISADPYTPATYRKLTISKTDNGQFHQTNGEGLAMSILFAVLMGKVDGNAVNQESANEGTESMPSIASRHIGNFNFEHELPLG
jgi:hypothetical protein